MKKMIPIITACLLFAVNGWGAVSIPQSTITNKTVNTKNGIISYSCLSGTTTKVLVVNRVTTNRGREVVGLLNACFEADGKVEYNCSTRSDYQWYDTCSSYLRVSGVTIPAHDTVHNFVEPKDRYAADRYFDSCNSYDDALAAPMPPHTYKDFYDAYKARYDTAAAHGKPMNSGNIEWYPVNGGQFFNAFWREATYNNNYNGLTRIFFQGEGFTFCYDSKIYLFDINSRATAILTEAAAEVMARKSCCVYLNRIFWGNPTDASHRPTMTLKETAWDFYPVTLVKNRMGVPSTSDVVTAPDLASLESNWHVWDGDHTYGGYDNYYNTYAGVELRQHIIDIYDAGPPW
jgi:hypothetical protein